MLLTAQNISYILPNRETLFSNVQVSLNKYEKAAVAGDNGTGKSTLLKILAGVLPPNNGTVTRNAPVYYVPQHFGQYNHLSVAAALGIQAKYNALNAILGGDTAEHHFEALADDWELLTRCEQAFEQWNIPYISLEQSFTQLSGGEKTKVFLAGIRIHQPACVLLDEPTNHLDADSRQRLYEWVAHPSTTLLTASHDRQLLELCQPIWELQATGIKSYGGNYSFYEEKKAEETTALQHKIAHAEKTVKAAKLQQQEAIERKQRENARGKKQAKKGDIPKILLNGRRIQAENSLAKIQEVHTDKVTSLQAGLEKVSAGAQVSRIMKGHFEKADIHTGKILVKADALQYSYVYASPLWQEPLSFTIMSGDRLAISGSNGSGKSTLVKLITGNITPQHGNLYRAPVNCLVLDQEYSVIDRNKTVLEQAESFNDLHLEPAMVKTILVRFLFDKEAWDKPCAVLSGGEILRLSLCCMTLRSQTPDVIILDEPTNNLDLTNIKMLTQIFAAYKGTLIVISHDSVFLEETRIHKVLQL
ncbi:MAG TPA: ABC-F family ATP-binding cassette domain-containing protein [Chitinophaga sp.]|uniref:ABC-F family ATP-binding cassette domain-containing protein n=1 Tax=Chitinophaga sp. TaxID=1869181 RepID=UPI002BE3CED6|nr:ABC-F family ATP-binding cassette domain-containing protein [Chitinophaga sp.]HVI43722.1 ABC-F family ATP-binding cassette domain-containing protein [Chitinophaga sp.]